MTQNPTFGTMDPYDPHMDNWLAYTERLHGAIFCGTNEKKAVLLTVISTKAYTLLRNILVPH